MNIGLLLSVAAGGALGAILRFVLTSALARGGFPIGVLSANILGSFVMGVAFVIFARIGAPQWQAFVMTGILGGFTTFSAFSLEAYGLWDQGQGAAALGYIALSVGGALVGLIAGLALARGVLAL